MALRFWIPVSLIMDRRPFAPRDLAFSRRKVLRTIDHASLMIMVPMTVRRTHPTLALTSSFFQYYLTRQSR
jgi:hypothetical protein